MTWANFIFRQIVQNRVLNMITQKAFYGSYYRITKKHMDEDLHLISFQDKTQKHCISDDGALVYFLTNHTRTEAVCGVTWKDGQRRKSGESDYILREVTQIWAFNKHF